MLTATFYFLKKTNGQETAHISFVFYRSASLSFAHLGKLEPFTRFIFSVNLYQFYTVYSDTPKDSHFHSTKYPKRFLVWNCDRRKKKKERVVSLMVVKTKQFSVILVVIEKRMVVKTKQFL